MDIQGNSSASDTSTNITGVCQEPTTEEVNAACEGLESPLVEGAVYGVEVAPDNVAGSLRTIAVMDGSEAIKKHHLLDLRDIERICSQDHRSRGLVAGFIGHRSVNMLIGDSGLGKSPLAYQLGLCVAGGIPFLGMKTDRGRVVYADYENGFDAIAEVQRSLTKFLGLTQSVNDLFVWSPDAAGVTGLSIEDMCKDCQPSLVIVDSLRSHDPSFEKSDNAGDKMSQLRSVVSKTGAAILAIHHVRKHGPDGPTPLDGEDTMFMHWLEQAAGHRSIINQSDTRIGADAPRRGRGGEMVLRWHRRMRSEGGPLYVERVCDDEGNPIGYRRAIGAALLENPEQQAAFGRLPEVFSFKEAKRIYGRSDDPTKKWLNRCQSVGLIEKPSRGQYRRLSGAETMSPEPIEPIEQAPNPSVLLP